MEKHIARDLKRVDIEIGQRLFSIAKEKDIVLVLGKGVENYQEIKGIKYSYSDYEVIDNYFKYSIKDKVKAW